MSRPVLSVVIPSHNGRCLLETCLASLARNRPLSPAIEVLVIDDGSRDDTRRWVAESHPWVECVRLETNGGFVLAANAGISRARGEFVQLLNNDAEVTEGWVEAGLRPFADPRVGSVAPLVLMRNDPSRVDSAGDRYAFFGWPSKRGHGEPAERWTTRGQERVFGASGSSAIYRKSVLDRIGPFDPSYESYYEDVDLAFRMLWAGFRCVFAPDCRILHDVSASYDHSRSDLQRRMARNAELLFWSNLPASYLMLAAVPHVVFTIAQAAMRLARGRLRPFLAGKRDAVRILRDDLAARRKIRADLAAKAASRPRFPIHVASVVDVRNHLRRSTSRG